jgi:hypothetical protein
LFLLIAIAGSLSQYLKGPQFFNNLPYTHYNNFIIFKQSFYHLLQGKDLYALYPSEYWDFYKYSPSFALFMAPFFIFPDLIGLILWNVLNCLVLYFALMKVSGIDRKAKSLLLLFVMIELFTSVQNAQSNGLLAGLLIMAYSALEKKEVLLATLLIIFSFYLKIFGIAAVILFFLYPEKLKFILYSTAWMFILGILPLLLISPEQLHHLYQGWINLLISDQSVSQGLSVMGILLSWFSLQIPKTLILLIAVVWLFIPLIRRQHYFSEKFKLNYFAALLIWLVIFNHKAESPTYIIAMSGVGLWFFSQKITPLNLALTVFAFIFISLSPTDLFPKVLRDSLIIPYQLKALPAVLIWLKIQYDLFFSKTPAELAAFTTIRKKAK